MMTIAAIKTYPNKTPVDALQAKLVAVYEYRSMDSKFGGQTTVQNIELQDAAGNKIRASVWDHPDLTDHKDKEYVFHAGNHGKGIEVKDGNYKGQPTKELSISKAGRLQYVEVYKASNPTAATTPPAATPAPATPAPTNAPSVAGNGQGQTPSEGPRPINGSKVGMALNNAVLILVHAGLLAKTKPDEILGVVKNLAMDLIELSNDLESGKAFVEESTPKPVPAAAPSAPVNKDDEPPF